MARGAPPRSPRERDSLAPAGLPRLLDLEVPPRANGSTAGRLGAVGSRAHHGDRESALGRATHPRRAAQARPRGLTTHRCPTHAASPEATLSDLAHVPTEPLRRPCIRRLLCRADRDLPDPLRVCGPAASSPASRALQRHRVPHCLSLAKTQSLRWTVADREARLGGKCPSYSLCWARCALRSGPAPTSFLRTWRYDSNSPCSAAARSDLGSDDSIASSGCGSRSGGRGGAKRSMSFSRRP